MKIGLLTRKLTAVYLCLALFIHFAAGCMRQSTEMISQSGQQPDNSLIAASHSSSFNYFQQKQKVSEDEKPGRVKLSATHSEEQTHQTAKTMQPAPVKISQAAFEDLERSRQQAEKKAKPVQKSTETILENWRSKPLVEAAKTYPSKVIGSYHKGAERIQQASGAISQEVSQGIQRLSGVSEEKQQARAVQQSAAEQNKAAMTPRTLVEVYRDEKRSQSVKQEHQQKVNSQINQLGKALQKDLAQNASEFEEVTPEMRRLQINSIMDRARRELKKENYQYAEFLAEQALETSYRGHIAFGLDEESPQMLLQKIKKNTVPQPQEDVKSVGHSQPEAQSNSGQRVPNFTPSRVHPLKRRAVAKPEKQPVQPKKVRIQPESSSSDELPLIVPRNMGGTPTQPRQTIRQKQGSISLEPPAFEQVEEAPTELPPIKQPVQQKEKPATAAPSVKLELEEVPADTTAKIQLSGPEAVSKEPAAVPESKQEQSAGPGPQLMLPKLPSVPGDLTSQNETGTQRGRVRKTQTAPVKFRSKIQERREDNRAPIAQEIKERREADGQVGTSLTLDEIEWDLTERKRPARKESWGSMMTLLLIAGGLIIALLSAIIVILLRRSTSSS